MPARSAHSSVPKRIPFSNGIRVMRAAVFRLLDDDLVLCGPHITTLAEVEQFTLQGRGVTRYHGSSLL
jgi:hypothetical protein